jgi:hypothetical protein
LPDTLRELKIVCARLPAEETIVLQVARPSNSLTVVVSRAGTPFAETWVIEKPKKNGNGATAP